MARYFSPETDPKLFRCPCGRPSCDARPPAPALLALLDSIRGALGHLVIVESGPRCEFWNTQVGGEVPSAHCPATWRPAPGLDLPDDEAGGFTAAADLQCVSSHDREVIDTVRRGGGHTHGYRRFGIGNTFVHVDVIRQRPDFPQDVLWHYYGIARRRAGARLEKIGRAHV